jgi:hypothetical protein
VVLDCHDSWFWSTGGVQEEVLSTKLRYDEGREFPVVTPELLPKSFVSATERGKSGYPREHLGFRRVRDERLTAIYDTFDLRGEVIGRPRMCYLFSLPEGIRKGINFFKNTVHISERKRS